MAFLFLGVSNHREISPKPQMRTDIVSDIETSRPTE